MRCPACDHDNIPGVDLCADCGMDLAGLDVKAWGVDPEDPVLAATLAKLPLKTPPVLAPTATVSEAITLMRERHEGCIFVCDAAEELVGVFTERDVTARVAARGRDPGQTRLAEVMTRQPVTLRGDDPLAWADRAIAPSDPSLPRETVVRIDISGGPEAVVRTSDSETRVFLAGKQVHFGETVPLEHEVDLRPARVVQEGAVGDRGAEQLELPHVGVVRVAVGQRIEPHAQECLEAPDPVLRDDASGAPDHGPARRRGFGPSAVGRVGARREERGPLPAPALDCVIAVPRGAVTGY